MHHEKLDSMCSILINLIIKFNLKLTLAIRSFKMEKNKSIKFIFKIIFKNNHEHIQMSYTFFI